MLLFVAFDKLKGKGKGEIFFRATRRAVRDVIALLKDRYLNDYSTTDAAQFRDHLLDRGLVSSTVKRVFAIIRAIINLSIQEYGLSCKNAFARTYMPEEEKQKRLAIMDQDQANHRFLTDGSYLVLTPRFSPNSQKKDLL